MTRSHSTFTPCSSPAAHGSLSVSRNNDDDEEEPAANCPLLAKQEKELSMPQRFLRVLTKEYGPYAFGLVSLLIMWQWVVSPELHRRDQEIMGYREFAQAVRESTAANVEAARLFRESTADLHSTIQRLEHLMEKR